MPKKSESPVVFSEEGSVPLEADIATSPEVISDPKMRQVANIGDRVKEAIEAHLCDCPNRQLALRYIDLAARAAPECNGETKTQEARTESDLERRAARQEAQTGRRVATGDAREG